METEDPQYDKKLSSAKNALSSYAKYTGVAFQMMAIIIAFAFIGYQLDKWAGNEIQWITALSCVIGVCFSIYNTIRQLK